MDVAKPYTFIGLGAMDVTKLYNFTAFGAMYVTKPHEFIGFSGCTSGVGQPFWAGSLFCPAPQKLRDLSPT